MSYGYESDRLVTSFACHLFCLGSVWETLGTGRQDTTTDT
jgi:hypothetical protein